MLIDSRSRESLELIESFFRTLGQRKQSISTAESCTGGLLATMLTDLPGSSDYYIGGVSSYSNKAKTLLLGVDSHLIETKGAVSEEVAHSMAVGIRTRLKSDYSISITGIAGPTGGTPQKPVGTVWCGFGTPNQTFAKKFQVDGNRSQIRQKVSQLAILELNQYILERNGEA